jgi:hypothetical protein
MINRPIMLPCYHRYLVKTHDCLSPHHKARFHHSKLCVTPFAHTSTKTYIGIMAEASSAVLSSTGFTHTSASHHSSSRFTSTPTSSLRFTTSPSPAPTGSSNSHHDPPGLARAANIGAGVGALIVALILLYMCCCCRRRAPQSRLTAVTMPVTFWVRE